MVLAILAGYPTAGCDVQARERQDGPRLVQVHDGANAPIEALVAAPQPTVLVRAGSGSSSSKLTSVALAAGQSAELAGDSSRFVKTSVLDTGTAPEWREDAVGLPRGWRLEVRARGELAWYGRAPVAESPGAWWHTSSRSRSISASQRILWADADDDGRRVVLGHEGSTRLVEQDARELALPAARSGRLSPDGRWLLLEHDGYLTIRTLERPESAAKFPATRLSEAVVFRADSRRLAWVALDVARVFELGEEARPVFEREAPADQEWRDALFDSDGGLVLGAIRAVQHGFRADPRTGTGARDPSATIRIERFGAGLQGTPEVLELPVQDWNSRSPELVLAGERLLMTVWPSVYEVRP